MLLEARLSAAHERTLRLAGAREPRRDVYRLMQAVYPASFLAMTAEGLARRIAVDAFVVCGLSVYVLAKALKYWAIATLGDRWTFRVLVPPNSARTLSGPYRLLRHPNYVAVAGELAGVGLAMHAWYSAPFALALFVVLMLRRVWVEERALAAVEE